MGEHGFQPPEAVRDFKFVAEVPEEKRPEQEDVYPGSLEAIEPVPLEIEIPADLGDEPQERPEETQGLISQIRKRIGVFALAGSLMAAAGNAEAKAPRHDNQIEMKKTPQAEGESFKHYFDKNPEFFRKVEGGVFSKAERAVRTKKIKKDVTVFKDIGVTFYKVLPGDSVARIRAKLSSIPEFSYLDDQRNKIQSFNIKDKWLKVGMDLPIPLENAKRELTDEQFYGYAVRAVEKMKTDEHYAGFTKQLLEVMSEEELVALVMGAAKTESGGKPMGHNEFHRFEKPRQGKSRFSYGAHHVMIEGPGAIAKKDLDVTLGQLYHPENSSKLFIGFLANKFKERGGKVKPSDFFPITAEKAAKFAEFYNGKYWRTRNKDYDKNINQFYHESLETIQSLETPVDPAELAEAPVIEEDVQPSSHQEARPVPAKKEAEKTNVDYVNIRAGKGLFRSVLDANTKNGLRAIKSDQQAMKIARRMMEHLRGTYKDDTYYPSDKIGVGVDRLGPVAVFVRGGKKAVFRVK